MFGFLAGSSARVRMVPRGLVYRGLIIKAGGWKQGPLSLVQDSTQPDPGLPAFLQAGCQSVKENVWPTEGPLDHLPGWKGPLRRYGSSCCAQTVGGYSCHLVFNSEAARLGTQLGGVSCR